MRGISIILHDRTQTGVDAFNFPVYTDSPVTVENVLVGQPTANEQIDALDLYGRKAVYTLGIPKGDTHDWSAGKQVEFFGRTWEIFGMPVKGIDALVPTAWNTKVMVTNLGTYED